MPHGRTGQEKPAKEKSPESAPKGGLERLSEPRSIVSAYQGQRAPVRVGLESRWLHRIGARLGGDGVAALRGIKEAGGITIAQKLETAAQPDMPGSAIASGCIDFVLSPEDVAQEIVGIVRGETLLKQSDI